MTQPLTIEGLARVLCVERDIDPDQPMKLVYVAPGVMPSGMLEWQGVVGEVLALRAHIAACGWQLVPKEPTGEMVTRGFHDVGEYIEHDDVLARAYKLMLAAAPKVE